MSGPTTKTIKWLFAVSGNQCAFPGCIRPLVDAGSGAVLGEICHIRARSPDGPRYDPAQTDEERHASENLLLLCPSHHKIVDDNPEEYIIERLLEIKAQHEAKHVGGKEASDEVARQFLTRIGPIVHGNGISRDKISVGNVGGGAVVTIFTGAPPDEKAGRTPAPAVAPIGPPHRDISRLSTEVDFQLFGRDQDLKSLDEVWSSPQVRLLSLFACGGMGKTALVNHWLRKYRDERRWRGTGLVFAYTFHSDSSDSFFDEVPRFLGVSCDTHSPEEKAVALVEAITSGADDDQRWLLVLDGIERVQRAPEGALSDPSVRLLLHRLADSHAPGLCITTSRLPLKEVFAYLGPLFVERELLPLDEGAGVELLQHMLAQLRGHVVRDDELHRVFHEFKGHPLTLRLIGGFLERDFRGDVLQVDLPLQGLGLDEEQAVHVMLDWYEASAYKDSLERDILHYLGVFDVPVREDRLRELYERSGKSYNNRDWNKAIHSLFKLGLIWELSPRRLIDCHPLVRAYFAARYKKQNHRAWVQVHSHLFQQFSELAVQRPKDLVEMEPLYRAVYHGCEAELWEDALYVFRERIRRGEEHHSFFRLGTVVSDLSALSRFFVVLWTTLREDLSEAEAAYVLNEVGSCLRVLGRSDLALGLIEQGFAIYKNKRDAHGSCRAARNYAKTSIGVGKLENAARIAAEACKFADESGVDMDRYISRATRARVLHLLGSFEQSENLFQEADGIRQTMPRVKFCLQESHYSELLLDLDKTDEVEHLLDLGKDVVPPPNDLDYGLYWAAMGKLHLSLPQPDLSAAIKDLEKAIYGLRNVGRKDELAVAQLALGHCHTCLGNHMAALESLQVAEGIASYGGLLPLEADLHLEYARYYLGKCRQEQDEAHSEALFTHLAAADDLIRTIRYRRREAALEALKAEAGGVQ